MMRVLLATVVLVSVSSGCTWGRITVGDSLVWYGDACTDQRTQCRADGTKAVIMRKDRPAFMRADPAEYLGSLVKTENVRTDRDPCIRPAEAEYEKVFERQLKVTIIAKKTVDASVKTAVDAALKSIPNVQGHPEVTTAVAASVRSALEENAFTNATYSVYTLSNGVLTKIKTGASAEHQQCRREIEGKPDRSFVWSVAVITADGKLKMVQSDQVEAAISASLDKFKGTIGVVDAAVKASAAISVISSIETSLDAEVKENNTVYSYGFWEPEFASPIDLKTLEKAADVESVEGPARAL